MLSFVGIWGEVTDTTSVPFTDFNKSFVSPCFSPRVFEDPGRTSHSDEGNTMVVGRMTTTVCEHSWFIACPVGGIYNDWDRSSSKSGGKISTVPDISETWDLEWSSSLRTNLLDSLVRIFRLLNYSFILYEIEGVFHNSTIASVISVWSWTVN